MELGGGGVALDDATDASESSSCLVVELEEPELPTPLEQPTILPAIDPDGTTEMSAFQRVMEMPWARAIIVHGTLFMCNVLWYVGRSLAACGSCLRAVNVVAIAVHTSVTED